MALAPAVRDNYIAIIDAILADSDLTKISEKKIRAGIQERVEYDITPQKAAIKELIMKRFDIFNARMNETSEPVTSVEAPEPHPPTNGHYDSPPSTPNAATPAKRSAEKDDVSDMANGSPPKKKRKPSVDADAMYAAKLQAEEDKLARPTRGGNSRKSATAKKKKTPKKKTSTRVRASDDSEIDDSESGEKKPPKNTGFHKPMILSPALSALFGGETMMSRPQSVKRLWEHIRANDLQDPSDRRQIRCDEAMRAVFKQDKVHMFQMTKILNHNLYNPEE